MKRFSALLSSTSTLLLAALLPAAVTSAERPDVSALLRGAALRESVEEQKVAISDAASCLAVGNACGFLPDRDRRSCCPGLICQVHGPNSYETCVVQKRQPRASDEGEGGDAEPEPEPEPAASSSPAPTPATEDDAPATCLVEFQGCGHLPFLRGKDCCPGLKCKHHPNLTSTCVRKDGKADKEETCLVEFQGCGVIPQRRKKKCCPGLKCKHHANLTSTCVKKPEKSEKPVPVPREDPESGPPGQAPMHTPQETCRAKGEGCGVIPSRNGHRCCPGLKCKEHPNLMSTCVMEDGEKEAEDCLAELEGCSVLANDCCPGLRCHKKRGRLSATCVKRKNFKEPESDGEGTPPPAPADEEKKEEEAACLAEFRGCDVLADDCCPGLSCHKKRGKLATCRKTKKEFKEPVPASDDEGPTAPVPQEETCRARGEGCGVIPSRNGHRCCPGLHCKVHSNWHSKCEERKEDEKPMVTKLIEEVKTLVGMD